MQLLGQELDGIPPTAHLHLRTPNLHKAAHREAAKQELMDAIAEELLNQAGDSIQTTPEPNVKDEQEPPITIPLAS